MNPYEEIERRATSVESLQESAEVLEILLSKVKGVVVIYF